MRILVTILAVLMFVAAGNAQTSVNTFPYSYNWTSPAAFNPSTGLGGGDGYWGTNLNSGTLEFIANATSGRVESNIKNNDDHLFVSVDATGKAFSGSEVFTFKAMRTGGASGTMIVLANSDTILRKDVAVDLSQAAYRSFSAPLPGTMSNSMFTLTIIVSAGNGFVWIDTTGISGGALPITLDSFKWSSSPGSVTLNWSTLSEINNYGFFVQKCDDLKSWTDVANSFQPGYGTTIEQHSYSFTDFTQPLGRYYRLRQVDLDGTNHYSDALSDAATSVDPTTTVNQFALEQNYPNPFNPSTMIKYTIGGAGGLGLGARSVSLVVYDILGRKTAVLVNETKQPGTYEVSFDATNLASGIYVYRLAAGSFVQSRRMLIMK